MIHQYRGLHSTKQCVSENYPVRDLIHFLRRPHNWVKNIWDERVENIYAELEVYDIEGNLVETFVTDKKDLESGEKILLEGYWDTLEVVEGNYNTIVVVRYGDRLLERNVETIVSKEAIKTSIKIAGRSVTVVEGERTLTWTIIISLIVLSIVNLLWFMHFGRTKR